VNRQLGILTLTLTYPNIVYELYILKKVYYICIRKISSVYTISYVQVYTHMYTTCLQKKAKQIRRRYTEI